MIARLTKDPPRWRRWWWKLQHRRNPAPSGLTPFQKWSRYRLRSCRSGGLDGGESRLAALNAADDGGRRLAVARSRDTTPHHPQGEQVPTNEQRAGCGEVESLSQEAAQAYRRRAHYAHDTDGGGRAGRNPEDENHEPPNERRPADGLHRLYQTAHRGGCARGICARI